jgi:rare lipoprotein A
VRTETTARPETTTHAATSPRASTRSAAPAGFEQRGKASWYGKEQHGGPTASGERFDMYRLTAAHRTLKFNTLVEVENLTNGKRVTVRINDRGPYGGHGRIIDVSYAAARALDMIDAGVVPVRIVVR